MIKFRKKKDKSFKFRLSDETKRTIERSTGKSIDVLKYTPLPKLLCQDTTKEIVEWNQFLSSYMELI